MNRTRLVRSAMAFLSGAVLLQTGGCVPSLADLLDIANTVLLGITAAGSLAILENI